MDLLTIYYLIQESKQRAASGALKRQTSQLLVPDTLEEVPGPFASHAGGNPGPYKLDDPLCWVIAEPLCLSIYIYMYPRVCVCMCIYIYM